MNECRSSLNDVHFKMLGSETFLSSQFSMFFNGKVIIIIIITCLNRMTISVIKTAINMGPVKVKK